MSLNCCVGSTCVVENLFEPPFCRGQYSFDLICRWSAASCTKIIYRGWEVVPFSGYTSIFEGRDHVQYLGLVGVKSSVEVVFFVLTGLYCLFLFKSYPFGWFFS